MNEILWELFYFMFGFPLMLVGVLCALMVISIILMIVGALWKEPSEKINTSPQLGGSFYDDDYSAYSETDEFNSKSPIEEMLDEQLILEDDEKYFGMDYGFLDEVEHY